MGDLLNELDTAVVMTVVMTGSLSTAPRASQGGFVSGAPEEGAAAGVRGGFGGGFWFPPPAHGQHQRSSGTAGGNGHSHRRRELLRL